MQEKKRAVLTKCIWVVAAVILFAYPLRHVFQGVDLWDGGYNYANFRYMGTEYMDSMWLFATWLANALGAFLTRLPFGDTMAGMNIYTGLLTGFLAAASFQFCVGKLKIPPWLAFAGEILALSLCWLPAAVLYNYLTYIFLFAGTAFLYLGLAEDKKCYLIAAGAVLGLNVGVRFSNLVQTGLILAVWAYGLLCRKKFSRVLKETGWCILGYAGGLGVFLLLMSAIYGLENYIQGILRLFAMTETASDYTAGSMLRGMTSAYIDSLYWLKRFFLAAFGGLLICLALPEKWRRMKQLLSALLLFPLAWWLRKKGFYTLDYTAYSSMLSPCVVMLVMIMGLGLFRIWDRKAAREEKLLAGLVILNILLASLGGNNAVYSSINNLFLVMPYGLWMIWKFCREKRHILFFPIKAILVLALLIMAVQSLRFGAAFVYEEADGGRHMDTRIDNVPVLKGMTTNAGKAAWITETYEYIKSNGLQDRECLLYGEIPGMSYYLEMAPALNIWSDLRSYTPETMSRDMGRLEEEIASGAKKPVIILEASRAQYVLDKNPEGLFWEESTEQKMQLICAFIGKYGYERTFENGKFVVYESCE